MLRAPPSVDAAVLRAVRRPEPLVPVPEAPGYLTLLRRAFAAQAPIERILPRAAVGRVAHELGFDPRGLPRDLDARQWAALHAATAARSARPHRRGPAPRRPPSSRR